MKGERLKSKFKFTDFIVKLKDYEEDLNFEDSNEGCQYSKESINMNLSNLASFDLIHFDNNDNFIKKNHYFVDKNSVN